MRSTTMPHDDAYRYMSVYIYSTYLSSIIVGVYTTMSVDWLAGIHRSHSLVLSAVPSDQVNCGCTPCGGCSPGGRRRWQQPNCSRQWKKNKKDVAPSSTR
eukprot:GHVS01067333.1.p2 GENE.GHVS01067333.1~~GHVS01067333.1.p2  ORF type:complete len:100 (+),score=16.10 GHVS01067333.1:486-785(+)